MWPTRFFPGRWFAKSWWPGVKDVVIPEVPVLVLTTNEIPWSYFSGKKLAIRTTRIA